MKILWLICKSEALRRLNIVFHRNSFDISLYHIFRRLYTKKYKRTFFFSPFDECDFALAFFLLLCYNDCTQVLEETAMQKIPETANVAFSPVSLSFVQDYLGMLNDPDVSMWLGSRSVKFTVESEIEWVDD